MVKTITKHFCEWPDCGEDYQTYAEAKSCEDKGFIHPYIKPGLVLKQSGEYELFTKCRTRGKGKGHERVYCASFFALISEGTTLKISDEGVYNYEMPFESLESSFENGRRSIMREEEFENIRGLVSEKFKEQLGGNELYREHSFFIPKSKPLKTPTS